MTTRAMIGPLSALDPAGNVVTGARFRVVKFGTSSGYGTGVVIADTLYAGPSTGVTLANPSVASGTSFEAWVNVPGTDVPDYVQIEYDDNEGAAYPAGVSSVRDWRVEPAPGDLGTSGSDLGWVDVEAEGADSSGSSDATTVFQSVMAPTDLYLRPGTYSLTDVLVNAGSFTRIRGGGMGLTILKARSGCTKLLDISSTDVTIQDLTIDGNGIAQYGLYFESLATGGTVERVEIKNCTVAGTANADQNHSWSFDRCHIHNNTGRGVIWIKRGQATRFDRCRIYANTLGQMKFGDGVTAMSHITVDRCVVQSTSGFPGVPNIQVSSQINPLVVRDCYLESFGAGGTDLTIDAGLSVSAVSWTGNYSTGNAQANYQFVVNSQVYLDLLASHGISYGANINDLTTTSRFFHIDSNEVGSVRVPFLLERVNPRFSVVTLSDAGTVTVDPRLGRFFTLSTAASRAMGAPSAPTYGMSITFDITNTSGGNITLTWAPAAYLLANGNVGPTIAAGKHHLIGFYYNATNALWIETGRSGDIG